MLRNLLLLLIVTIEGHVSLSQSWNASYADEEYRDGNKSTGSNFIQLNTGPNLNEICILLNISLHVCSCNINPDLCPFESFIENVLNATGPLSYTRSKKYTLVYATITVFASLFGAVANAAVLLVAYKQRRDTPSCKLHIAELAVVNFSFSVVQIINAVPLFWTNTWIYNLSMCKVIRTLLEMGTLMTIGFILIIAVERFLLIVYPIESRYLEGNFKHAVVAMHTCFVVATLIPYTIGLHIEKGSGRCIQFQGGSRRLSLPYNWFVLTFYSLLPACIITLLYGKIIAHLSRLASSINPTNNSSLHLKKLRTNRHIAYVTLAILLCFLLCTLPTRIFLIYMEMKDKRMGSVDVYVDNSKDLYLILTFISYVSYPFQSTVNPILYSMLNTEWRKEMRDILRLRRRYWR